MIQLASLQLISALIMIIASISMLFGGIILTENALDNTAQIINGNDSDISSVKDGGYLSDNNSNTSNNNYYINNNLNNQIEASNISNSTHLLTYGQEKINLFNRDTKSIIYSHVNADRAPPQLT